MAHMDEQRKQAQKDVKWLRQRARRDRDTHDTQVIARPFSDDRPVENLGSPTARRSAR